MDLLKPKRYNGEVDEYKLQFSFNGAVSYVAVAAYPVPEWCTVPQGNNTSRRGC
jgi:hypothetical protein